MTKKILVTGGAGFIGSHLCERLVGAGNEVVAVDNLITGRKENLEDLSQNKNFRLVEADASGDPRDYLGKEKFDDVFHLASPASPADFARYPVEIYRVNVWGTDYLAQKATREGSRFLFASTSEVYGEPLVHPQKEVYRGNVNIRGLRSAYDESKRMGETIQTVWARTSGLNIRTVRIFNTYGPRMREDDGRLIPNFIHQALKGERLKIYGDGKQTRSFCFVDDLVAGLVAVMENTKAEGEVYNLGNDTEKTVLEMAELIIQKTGSKSQIQFVDLPEDDPSRRKPDLTKVKSEIGWEPKVGLDEGLEKTINYFRKKLGV